VVKTQRQLDVDHAAGVAEGLGCGALGCAPDEEVRGDRDGDDAGLVQEADSRVGVRGHSRVGVRVPRGVLS